MEKAGHVSLTMCEQSGSRRACQVACSDKRADAFHPHAHVRSKQADFPLIADFESHFEEIQAEFDAVYANVRLPQFDEVVPGQTFLNTDRRWKSFQLRAYNRDFEFNHKLCPLTSSLVRKHGADISYAMFSVIEGPKDIPPHMGLYSGVLRVHMGLRVPSGCAATTNGRPNCYIKIMNETATWSEGRGMIFDDSLTHEVHMGVAGVRGILFLDVRRPVDQWWASLANRAFLWYSRYIPLINGIEARARWYTEGNRGRRPRPGEPMQDEL